MVQEMGGGQAFIQFHSFRALEWVQSLRFHVPFGIPTPGTLTLSLDAKVGQSIRLEQM